MSSILSQKHVINFPTKRKTMGHVGSTDGSKTKTEHNGKRSQCGNLHFPLKFLNKFLSKMWIAEKVS